MRVRPEDSRRSKVVIVRSAVLRRALLTITIAIPLMSAAGSAEADLERRFTKTVRPFLATYCAACHSGKTPTAQFDVPRYSTMAAVVQDHPRWALVLEKLTTRAMPPKQVQQPDAETRQKVVGWIEAVSKHEARKHAGDPGPVLARRLSNAEYNYTIRDLTGVDLRPAQEFPVDPANPAGFDNSGESLSMSPALLGKYLQAAREVSNHLVLKPDGIVFAPHPMLVETDREKYAIQRIVDFYDRQPTDYADYFRSAWRYKHRAFFRQSRSTLAGIAAEDKVSARYLARIWEALERKEDVGPLAKLQAMWRVLPAPESGQMDAAREGWGRMRDFVVQLRKKLAPTFLSPEVSGLNYSSQPLWNWKLREFATHRRDFDRSALRVEGEPSPVQPPDAPFRGTRADRAANEAFAAASFKARIEDPNLLVPAGERARYEAAFARFSSVFPDAFYIRERGRFYPDDSRDQGRLLSAGFHNVMGYFRDDIPLIELVLDEKEQKELDTLWREFDFIADVTIRTFVQFYFNQSGEVRGLGGESGNARPSDKEVTSKAIVNGLREAYLAKAEPSKNPAATRAIEDHFQRMNTAIRWVEQARLDAEPRHLDALLNFAARAYRRPLSQVEHSDLLAYYWSLRKKSGLTHEEAMRDSIAAVLMSPDFCYRIDLVDARAAARPSIAKQGTRPVSDYALASKLSYFLWSSMPDEELLTRAAAGDLSKPETLAAQARRMLKDERACRLATEFGGHWLDFRRFEENNTVDRQRFPNFNNELRQAMFEEPVRFLADVIRKDRSVLDLLYANHTFVNPVLARHYGMPQLTGKADEWLRVEDAHRYGRGGLLTMSVFLTQNAPGLRTSPVKRGYWVARRVLGEVIPPPPAVVPELPQDEAKLDLPLRDMLAKHRDNPSCASCHVRFDSFGLVFEDYGPVGEKRTKDLSGRAVDTRAEFPGGSQGAGFEGLRRYIHAHREKDFIDNLSRKMLVYALGRSLMLSDEPTVERMRRRLAASGYRFAPLVETIVTSPQFLTKRTSDFPRPER